MKAGGFTDAEGRGGLSFLIPSVRQVAGWARLTLAKHRRREGLFLAEGVKVVTELLRVGGEIEALLVMAGREELVQRVDPRDACGAPRYRIDEKNWRRLSQDKTPEGIMAVARRLSQWAGGEPRHVEGTIVVGHGVGNPNNLGALIRTMHWFGVRTLYLTRGSVDTVS
ncbi:MAG: hypothetical protein N2Z74_07740, partial [Syntrophales bacterium]|nr:hypothetical protein [Syntrophales bacterium]